MPCEVTQCPYEPSPAASQLSPANVDAWHIYVSMQAIGIEATMALTPLRLSAYEAEMLRECLVYIHAKLAEFRRPAES